MVRRKGFICPECGSNLFMVYVHEGGTYIPLYGYAYCKKCKQILTVQIALKDVTP